MISITEANEGDKGRLLAFFEKNAGTDAARRMAGLWDWQWHGDPRLEQPGYRGVVAEWRGQLIGSVSCPPAGLYVHGEPLPAVWLVDVRIDWALARRALRDIRSDGGEREAGLSKGIAAALFDHPAAGTVQLGKHIAEPMMAICRRIGFVTMPEAANYTRRTSVRQPLEKALGRSVGRLLAVAADPLVVRVRRPALNVRAFDAELDGRFDRLWERAKSDYPAITRRDAAVLNWRYRRHPDTVYRVFVIERDAGIRGYAVSAVVPRAGRLFARIVDLLTVKGDGEAAESLLAAALRQCRDEGAERTDFFATGAELIAASSRLGFAPRLTKKNKLQPLLCRNLPDLPLYVTTGDGDGG